MSKKGFFEKIGKLTFSILLTGIFVTGVVIAGTTWQTYNDTDIVSGTEWQKMVTEIGKKVNSSTLSNYYTKTEIDNAYYTKSDINNTYYSKADIDAMIARLHPAAPVKEYVTIKYQWGGDPEGCDMTYKGKSVRVNKGDELTATEASDCATDLVTSWNTNYGYTINKLFCPTIFTNSTSGRFKKILPSELASQSCEVILR